MVSVDVKPKVDVALPVRSKPHRLIPARMLQRRSSIFCSNRLPFCSFPPAVGSCGRRNQSPIGENTEFKRSPFKAWSRSVYLADLFLPFRSIHLHFSQTSPDFFSPVLAVASTVSCVGPQNKIGYPAECRFPC